MTIDMSGTGDASEQATVVFNATPGAVDQAVEGPAGSGAELHQMPTSSVDEAFAEAAFDEAAFDDAAGTFTVPGRTVAVSAS